MHVFCSSLVVVVVVAVAVVVVIVVAVVVVLIEVVVTRCSNPGFVWKLQNSMLNPGSGTPELDVRTLGSGTPELAELNWVSGV